MAAVILPPQRRGILREPMEILNYRLRAIALSRIQHTGKSESCQAVL